jgi:LysM repeat protein
MSRKQIALIIGANAVISTVISVIVALLMVRTDQPASTATPTAGAAITQPVAGVSPTAEPVVHVVRPGDTISGLAFEYDVPEQDIIAANQLANPNLLAVGTELIIPIGGVPNATATFTPAPTPTDTPLPIQPPSADMTATAAAEAGATATPLPTSLPTSGQAQIEISEIIAPGEIDQEHVVITNVGDSLADMQGWTLSDPQGNTYTFPNFKLWPQGNVTVNSRIGQDNPPFIFFWGKLEPVWSVGEVATLKNADGQVIATYVAGR